MTFDPELAGRQGGRLERGDKLQRLAPARRGQFGRTGDEAHPQIGAADRSGSGTRFRGDRAIAARRTGHRSGNRRARRIGCDASARAIVDRRRGTGRTGRIGFPGDLEAARVGLVFGRLEGVLVAETQTSLTIDLGMGRISLPRSAVQRIERKESALSEYRTRLAAIEPGDVKGFAELARFAAGNGLRSEARLMWARVVSLDPNNVEGHLYLGHVLVAGRYMEEEEAQRAQGNVHFEGRWMTPAEQDSILRARDRRAADDRNLEEARRAAREAEDRARRAERQADRARAEAAANSPAAWGYGSTVVIGSPYGYGGGYYPVVDPYYGGGKSCWQVKHKLKMMNFKQVQPFDCSAPTYRFTAKKNGNHVKVKTNVWGNILAVY